MFFETGDVLPFDTRSQWRSPSPPLYVSTIYDGDQNKQVIDDQDKNRLVSDSEINKMLAMIFGIIILWIGVLVGIGFAIKTSDERNIDHHSNDDMGIESFSQCYQSEMTEKVSDNSIVLLTLLATVLVGFLLLYLYRNTQTTTPSKQGPLIPLYSIDTQSNSSSAQHLNSNKNR